ncbi:hypothetical protein BGW80DRAFT_1476227 [Lactifluus volemus]|nr:hypothetical protein BGW80DRAFT_1476227 [Lactifluus volemus]
MLSSWPASLIEHFSYPLHAWEMTSSAITKPAPDTDTLRLKDQTAYDFRFVDYTPALDAAPHPRYLVSIPISTLVTSSAQLIQLGTLFGSSRLHFTEPGHLAARTAIRERMAFANPHLRAASLAAANALGGQDAFLAAHVRLSNGRFCAAQAQTVRSIWYHWLGVHCVVLMPARGATPRYMRSSVSWYPLTLFCLYRKRRPSIPCRRTNAHPPSHNVHELAPLNVPLFIATDIEDAPTLAPLRAAFPCTFLLRDLADVPDGEDGVRLGPFLEPLLDATIASRAWAVVGTEGSTFSRYVEDFLWQREHGRQIVSVGSWI